MIQTENLDKLVEVLKAGGVVACPTETFVGLLADALNEEAIRKVQILKGRDENNPIGVLIPNESSVGMVAKSISEDVQLLTKQYWPGPLTLVLQAKKIPSALVKDGKVGVRVPGSSPALDLARAFGGPLTATSANRSGLPPREDTRLISEQLFAEPDAVFFGSCPGGLPSTVVDITRQPYRLIREGAIQLDQTLFD